MVNVTFTTDKKRPEGFKVYSKPTRVENQEPLHQEQVSILQLIYGCYRANHSPYTNFTSKQFGS